jgi:carbonic anhydrase/acetyltransferase-like protein (isoleucine patch superfamily)
MPLYAFKAHIPWIHPSVFVAPSAQIIGNVRIGRDSSVWFQTVIRGDLDMKSSEYGTWFFSHPGYLTAEVL